jgi:hypothetical protein
MAAVSSLQVEAGYLNYQNVVLTGCASAATPATTPPSIADKPPVLGVASQGVALADFMNAGIPSALYSFAATTQAQVNFVNLTKFPAVSTSTVATSSGVATIAVGDFNKDGKYDFAAVVTGDQTATNPEGCRSFSATATGRSKRATPTSPERTRCGLPSRISTATADAQVPKSAPPPVNPLPVKPMCNWPPRAKIKPKP